MKARGLIGTRRTQATRLADVSRLHDPDARQRNARLLRQAFDDALRDHTNVAFAGDSQRKFL